ncbi:MAG: tyrosine-type recombinase/integrase [Elusimicrobia bacterium]|nr:tyrosine-type recombinase/integrase [Elusimicrobiota bacterium]
MPKPIKPNRSLEGEAAPPLFVPPAELRIFLRHIASNGLARGTRERYEDAINRLFRYHPGRTPAEMTPELIDEFLEAVRKVSSPATTNLVKSAIRAFFGFLVDTGRIDKDPSRLIRNEKITRKSPPILSEDLWGQLLGAIEQAIGRPPKPGPLRDFTLYSLVHNTGLRVSELVDLDVVDVEERRWLEIIGKGRKLRRIPLNGTACRRLARYLTWRKIAKAKDVDALFLSLRGRRYGVRDVQRSLKAWLEAAAIKQDLWPHLLRHMFLTNIQNTFRNLRVTQAIAGHSSVQTTQIYTHVDDQEMEAAANSIG